MLCNGQIGSFVVRTPINHSVKFKLVLSFAVFQTVQDFISPKNGGKNKLQRGNDKLCLEGSKTWKY